MSATASSSPRPTRTLSTCSSAFLGNRSSLGAIDELYYIAESLDPMYLNSIPFKSMILHPRSTAWAHCKSLGINLDDSDPEVFFRCRTWSDFSARTCCISSYPNCFCSYGQVMDTMITVFQQDEEEAGNGVFVKGVTRFMMRMICGCSRCACPKAWCFLRIWVSNMGMILKRGQNC